jgi:hypothetical protein
MYGNLLQKSEWVKDHIELALKLYTQVCQK